MHTVRAIVIGGSAGSLPLVSRILSGLPSDFALPVFLVLHRLKHVPHGLLTSLAAKSNLKIVEPDDNDRIIPGVAYLAPANYHMYIDNMKVIALSTEPMVKFSRPAIDLTFETAAAAYREGLVGVMLSGANTDGANGMAAVKNKGGYTIVQNPEEAGVSTMPKGAIAATEIDFIGTLDEIINKLKSFN
jgi:two-component system, chemotaxis family, protein-glutamate methylesterase/glutaminase